MIARVFHRWERRLASGATDRVARPFEWGLEWLAGEPNHAGDPRRALQEWGEAAIARSDDFYAVTPAADYALHRNELTFTSAIETPHAGNNLVRARYFPDASPRGRRRAVLVLPQWNSDAEGHVGLCRLLNRFGISALRLSMPYHDARMPPELTRADYIVSASVGRTAQVCRQAVLDARRAIAWLHAQGYTSIGILGTSLGSCLSMLTTAHEPLIKAAALNHISPFPYLDRVRDKRILLVYARYDLTFPVRLSKMLVDEFRRRNISHDLHVLPCGHYSTGVTPFKWIDGLALCRFLNRSL